MNIRCNAEMCPSWTGDGCICAVFGDGPKSYETCTQVMYGGWCDNWPEPDEILCALHLYEPDRDDVWGKADDAWTRAGEQS